MTSTPRTRHMTERLRDEARRDYLWVVVIAACLAAVVIAIATLL